MGCPLSQCPRFEAAHEGLALTPLVGREEETALRALVASAATVAVVTADYRLRD
jgi:hypothetical protein